MAPGTIFSCILGYFALLLLIAWFTGRKAGNAGYFLGNKSSPWYAVAFGLLGDSLSGVTFISVPGQVGTDRFSYFQMVLGYVLGYVVIAEVLLPLYYKLNLTSIYSYLRSRFGLCSQRTGSFFFLLSRTAGAAARLYLAAHVIQRFVFDSWKIPFWLLVSGIILLMLAYTFQGGIKTLVWTDTFQSTFLLLGVVLSLTAIARELQLDFPALVRRVYQSETSRVFFWDWKAPNFFWKQLVSGALIAIAMTGLDQNMMQKNLSCRTLGEAKKNVYWFTLVMVLVNLLFLSLGTLLHAFAQVRGIPIPAQTDELFPLLALQHLGSFAALVFVVGLTAATFSSADSVLTTLTTSFCLDILGMDRESGLTEAQTTRRRHLVHLGFAVLLLGVILLFRLVNTSAVIKVIFTLATYTYGPLLGLFAFGILHRRPLRDRAVPIVCVVAPLLCLLLKQFSARWFWGYQIGFELLLLNALTTYAGLWVISRPLTPHRSEQETSSSPALSSRLL